MRLVLRVPLWAYFRESHANLGKTSSFVLKIHFRALWDTESYVTLQHKYILPGSSVSSPPLLLCPSILNLPFPGWERLRVMASVGSAEALSCAVAWCTALGVVRVLVFVFAEPCASVDIIPG